MSGDNNEIIYNALCENIRHHQTLLKNKEEQIQQWVKEHAEAMSAKQKYMDLYLKATTEASRLKTQLEEAEKEVSFWKDRDLTRQPARGLNEKE